MADNEVSVLFGADTADFNSGVDEVKEKLGETGGEAIDLSEQFDELGKKLVAAFSVEKLIEFTKSALEAADALYILGERTGIAASTLSALNIPLLQNGSSVGELAASMRFLQRSIQEASEGSATAIKKFDDLGLSVTKLKELTPEQQLFATAQALGQVGDQSKLTNDTIGLLGRSAQGLIPVIKETSGDLKDMADQIKAGGGALTDEQIKKVHEFDDAWISAWEHMKIYAVEATIALSRYLAMAEPGGALVPPEPSKEKTPGFLSDEEAAKIFASTQAPNPAAGTNNDIAAVAKQSAQDMVAAEQQADQQALAAWVAMEKAKQEAARGNYDAQIAIEQDILDRLKDYYGEMSTQYQTALREMERLQNESALKMQQQWDGVFNLINRDLDTMLSGVLQGTQTWQQAMARLFDDLAISFIEAVAKMMLKWAAFEALGIGSNPFSGGIFSAIGGIGALAAFDVGTSYVPQTGPALIHQGEIILPPDISAQVRSGQAVIGTAGTTANGGGAGGNTYVTINAVDTQSVANLLKSNSGVITQIVNTQTRNFAMRPAS